MKIVQTVCFILIKDGKVLVERRRMDRLNDPSAVVVPGGHVGYRVDTLFLIKQSPYHQFLRVGETTYFPGK